MVYTQWEENRNHRNVFAPFKPPRQVIDLTKDENSQSEEIQLHGKTWFVHNGEKREVIDLTEDNDSQSEEECNSDPIDPFYDEHYYSEEICSDEDDDSRPLDEDERCMLENNLSDSVDEVQTRDPRLTFPWPRTRNRCSMNLFLKWGIFNISF